MSPLLILFAAAVLWWAAMPRLDPVRVRAKSSPRVTPQDEQDHAAQVQDRQARWEKERRELAQWTAKPRSHAGYGRPAV